MSLPATVEITPFRKYKRDLVTKTVEVPKDFKPPLIINCGMGTDSVHMLHHAWRTGVVPSLVIFANTLGEKRRTYEVMEEVRQLVKERWDLDLVVVNRTDVYPLHEGGHKYTGLMDNCLENRTMPSLAYHRHSCSLKWKAEVMDRWIEMYFEPAMITWALGMKVTKWIGYDSSPADLKRSKIREDEWYRYDYPIRDNNETRPDCIASIDKAQKEESSCVGQPGKSACFFCPACKSHELLDLYNDEPEKLAQALLMEVTALNRTFREYEGLVTIFGLGSTWNWSLFMSRLDPEKLAFLDAHYDAGAEHRTYVFAELYRRAANAQAELVDLEAEYAQWRDNEAKDARDIIKKDHDVVQVAEAHAFLEEYKVLQKRLPQLRKIAAAETATEDKVAEYLAGVREEVGGGGF